VELCQRFGVLIGHFVINHIRKQRRKQLIYLRIETRRYALPGISGNNNVCILNKGCSGCWQFTNGCGWRVTSREPITCIQTHLRPWTITHVL